MGSQEPVKLVGVVQGCNLIWARAKFEHPAVQINKFNKLRIEIFSKIAEPLKIAQVEVKMSQASLNRQVQFKDGPGYYELTKSNPIVIEESFYLEKEDNEIGCIMLNQLVLNIAQGDIGVNGEN